MLFIMKRGPHSVLLRRCIDSAEIWACFVANKGSGSGEMGIGASHTVLRINRLPKMCPSIWQ
jgi:hypothetical protein